MRFESAFTADVKSKIYKANSDGSSEFTVELHNFMKPDICNTSYGLRFYYVTAEAVLADLRNKRIVKQFDTEDTCASYWWDDYVFRITV
jgi:hypothetical protein